MNKNIEFIIPNKLAAVKFSYIPFISEIDYKPDPDTPAYTEDLRITDQGVLLLNKDRPGYDVLQKIFRQVVPLPYTRLRWQRKKLATKSRRSLYDNLYLLCIDAEHERRQKVKQGRCAIDGND